MPRNRTTVSRSLAAALRTFSPDFNAYTTAFAGISARREQLAPAFLKLWRFYARETGGTFIAFVRELDREVPAEKRLYARHHAYQSALYLRRIAEAPQTQAKYRQTMLPFDLLARVIKGVLPLVHPHEGAAWNAIKAQSGWRPRDLQRLEARVEHAMAIAFPTAPRLVTQASRSSSSAA